MPTTRRSGILTASSNLLLYIKEVKEGKALLGGDFLMAKKYLLSSNRKPVEEFVINEMYECQVIVTNISEISKNVQILTQIPVGSMPLLGTAYQIASTHAIGSFTPKPLTCIFLFYLIPNSYSYTQLYIYIYI